MILMSSFIFLPFSLWFCPFSGVCEEENCFDRSFELGIGEFFLLLLAKFEKTIHIVFLYPVCVLLVLIINRHIGESDSRGLIWVSTATGTLQFEYFLFTTTYSLVMG